MTRAIAAIVLAPLAAVFVSVSTLVSVSAAPPPSDESPVALQRVWVEADGEIVWEVVCLASLTARQCLERDVVSDLLGDRPDSPDHTLFFDASAGDGGEYTVRTARLSGARS